MHRSLGLAAIALLLATAALGGGSAACSAPTSADDGEAAYDAEAAMSDATPILSPPVEHFK